MASEVTELPCTMCISYELTTMGVGQFIYDSQVCPLSCGCTRRLAVHA